MLPTGLRAAVEKQMSARILREQPAHGGCINEACALSFDNSTRAFLKYNLSAPADLFLLESEGLAELAEAGEIRVPEVYCWSSGNGKHPPFILMELITEGSRSRHSDQVLARGLIRIHRKRAKTFGWRIRNYLGQTSQPNSPTNSWATFYMERRLGVMLELLEKSGSYASELQLMRAAFPRIEALLEQHKPEPCLVHGDLWSGNVLWDQNGSPVLIDPATYYADREVDLAMAALFGGFSSSFFQAYQEEWPLPAGHADRRPVYQLYHLLHHALLFGGGYMSQCIEIARVYT